MKKDQILVIDGHYESRESLKWMLREAGFEVLTAENAAVAFDLLASCEPALILTELMMPLVAGEEFIKALKGQPKLRATPIVVLSAYGNVFREIVKAAGATAVLSKPRDLPVVLETIKKLLRKPQACSC